MKKRAIRVLAAIAALALISVAALAEVRTTGNVWLRSGPGLDYEALSILSEGKTFEYLGESSVDERGVAWYEITAGEKTGWVSSRYSELIGESAETEAEADAEEAPAPTEAPASQSALDAGILFMNGDTEDAPEEETPEEDNAEQAVPEQAVPEKAASVEDAPEKESAPGTSNAPVRTVELSGYYLNNLVEAANAIGLISYRQVESEVPYQYYDDSVIIAGNQLVESIVVYGAGYEVYGVSVGMNINAARACLNAAGLDYVESVNGVTYEHRANALSLFTDPKGHDSCINVWVDDGGTVTEIDWSSYTG